MTSKTAKIEVKLSPKALKDIQNWVTKVEFDGSIPQLLRVALGTYRAIVDETKSGSQLMLQQPDGKLVKVLITGFNL